MRSSRWRVIAIPRSAYGPPVRGFGDLLLATEMIFVTGGLIGSLDESVHRINHAADVRSRTKERPAAR
jgi:hypothetical protein